MSTTDRVKSQTKRATVALSALKHATTAEERLAAAQALESAACQLRRALKQETSQQEGTSLRQAFPFQLQLRWDDHKKGPDHWQTMNGLYASREAAEAKGARAMATGEFTEMRVIEKETSQ
jgi:hypothetical protein